MTNLPLSGTILMRPCLWRSSAARGRRAPLPQATGYWPLSGHIASHVAYDTPKITIYNWCRLPRAFYFTDMWLYAISVTVLE